MGKGPWQRIPIVEPEQAVLSLVYAAGAQALEVYCRHAGLFAPYSSIFFILA